MSSLTIPIPDSKQVVKDSVDTVTSVSNQVLTETYNTTFQSLNMGFSLAAALAWNEAVKELIKKRVSSRFVESSNFFYALVVTLLAALVFSLTKQFVKPNLQKQKPVLAVI